MIGASGETTLGGCSADIFVREVMILG